MAGEGVEGLDADLAPQAVEVGGAPAVGVEDAGAELVTSVVAAHEHEALTQRAGRHPGVVTERPSRRLDGGPHGCPGGLPPLGRGELCGVGPVANRGRRLGDGAVHLAGPEVGHPRLEAAAPVVEPGDERHQIVFRSAPSPVRAAASRAWMRSRYSGGHTVVSSPSSSAR